MYGSTCLSVLSYLSLSRGIMSHISLSIIYIECTMIHNACLWVLLQERNNVTNRYKVFTFIITIIFYLYNTINIIHKCKLNCKDFLVSSFSSSFYLICLLLSSLLSILTNLQLHSIYTALGGIAK